VTNGQAEAMVERIVVLAPMVSELRPVVKAFGLTPAPRDGDPKRHTGRVGEAEIVATMTGIGTKLAEQVTERVLASESVDRVIVVGIAGGVGKAVEVGSVFMPDVVVHKSTGAEFQPKDLAGVERRGRLVTSDDFEVEDEELAKLEAAGVIALDMETSAVAAVCEKQGCPWSVVRAISDMANNHPIGENVMNLANADGSANVAGFLKYVATHPGKVPQLMKLGRDSQLAARVAAETAARACAQLA
jgi:adenosylhomocysteine nucleosidase